MRAVVQDKYGPPDVLHQATVPVPTPTQAEIRVRVAAASVNARDWHIMRGEPRLARLLDRQVFGRTAPRVAVRGTDFAGIVDSVGDDVHDWQPGDRVFGETDGALAEYVLADRDRIARIPHGVPFGQAAAVPLAGTTAATCLDAAHPPSQPHAASRILINGASGGVGTFALQMAKARGLHVTAVCSARNIAQARDLGADVTIDYRRQDFCDTPDRYDVVLDLVGNRSLRRLRRLVSPTGTLVLSGGGVSGEGRVIGPLGLLIRAQLLARLPGPLIAIPQATPTHVGLAELATQLAAGGLRPVIDRTFGLDNAADAVRYLETEHARGKVIVTIHGEGPAEPDAPLTRA